MQARVQAKLVQEGFQPLDGTREVQRVLLRQKTILTPPKLNIKYSFIHISTTQIV